MDANNFSSTSGDHSNNFEFAFNSSNFSDRVLRIEIVAGGSESRLVGGGCSSVADWDRHRKRRREGIKKQKAAEFDVVNSDNIVNLNQPDTEDDVIFDLHEDAVEMVDSPSGDVPSPGCDSLGMDCSPVIREKSIYITSAILAAKSPFFYKLFSNGMLESDQRHATLRINASEEAALMELLSFMYSGKLSTTSSPLVLDVLMAADKFEVASCMRYCSQLLRSIPMTTESALLYLELPSSVSIASAVQPLTDSAKEFIANKYCDINKCQDELMNLPVAAIEAILMSDKIQVASEDVLFDMVIRWAKVQYPVPEDRREIIRVRVGRLIRFPFMTCRKLRKVLISSELDQEFASKAVLDALFFKAETPFRQRALASEEHHALSNRRFVDRAYKYRPVKIVEFELPHPQCIVYLDLKKDECAGLFPSGRVYSQAFHLGGQGFFLSAHCNMDTNSSFYCFGMFLGMQDKGATGFTVDYEFAARTRPTGEFASKYKGYYMFTGGKAVGYRNLFATPWISFIAEDSPYFINGVLHLRAELTIKPQQQPQPQPQQPAQQIQQQ